MVTDADMKDLQSRALRSGVPSPLREELDRAQVVTEQEAPASLVKMNSRVRFEELTTGKHRAVALVYPEEADVSAGRLSVYSPVGTALLGLTVGQEIEWELPQGRVARLRVIEVVGHPDTGARS
jgi:regulator of nucleoside diphosphate kinase